MRQTDEQVPYASRHLMFTTQRRYSPPPCVKTLLPRPSSLKLRRRSPPIWSGKDEAGRKHKVKTKVDHDGDKVKVKTKEKIEH